MYINENFKNILNKHQNEYSSCFSNGDKLIVQGHEHKGTYVFDKIKRLDKNKLKKIDL